VTSRHPRLGLIGRLLEPGALQGVGLATRGGRHCLGQHRYRLGERIGRIALKGLHIRGDGGGELL
jgi:hypothetical protein